MKEECEYKEIAVLSFWVITLKPFLVVNCKSPIYNCPNEMFALYLILSVICGIYEKNFLIKNLSIQVANVLKTYYMILNIVPYQGRL